MHNTVFPNVEKNTLLRILLRYEKEASFPKVKNSHFKKHLLGGNNDFKT